MTANNTPITERLAEALRQCEATFSDIFAQCASNGMKNAWGHPVDHTQLNKANCMTGSALREYDRLRTHPAEGGEGRDSEGMIAVLVEALRAAREFIDNGRETGYITMPKSGDDPAHKTPALIEGALCAYIMYRHAAPPPQPVAPERGEAKAVATCRICGKSSPRMTVCDACDESSGPWGGTAVLRDLPNEPESSIHVEKPEPFTYAVVRKDVSPDFFMSRRAAEDAIAASNNRTAKIVNLYATPQPPQPVAPEERGEAVAWRSRYTMEAGRLSDWHYVDKFVPVASPSTGYEVEALYTAPPPPDRVQPERVEAVPGDDDFVAPPPSEWSKAGQRRLMEALEAAPPTDATDRVEAVECDYCGGSGFINVLDEDGEPVLDFCDAPAHDTPNDASGVTEAAVQALKDSLWSSWGASRQTTDWPNMQQLRAALEAADRARTAPQSPRFRDPTIEDAGRLLKSKSKFRWMPDGTQDEFQRNPRSAMLAALMECGFVVNAIGAKVGDKT